MDEKENEFLLFDRITKIKSVVRQYGEESFYISYSGGKDSNVVDALVDMALPDNQIPRVYCNTGIELDAVKEFVQKKQANDSRVIIIKPGVPIKQMLERDGYPFKSKSHASMVAIYRNRGTESKAVKKYIGQEVDGVRWKSNHLCPDILLYQFAGWDGFKISDKCCLNLKEKPLDAWAKEHGKTFAIIGIMPDEGGRRESAKCIVFTSRRTNSFHPLVPLSKEWEDWFIEKYDVALPAVYYAPYSFERTGCKGCPFGLKLQEALDTMQKYFPKERKQCEAIWKPVYQEYRRLGYRLRTAEQERIYQNEQAQMDIFDFIES